MSTKEVKGDKVVLENVVETKDLSGSPTAPKTGYQNIYVRNAQVMAQDSGGTERNLEENNKVTNNTSISSQTVINATTHWHPSLVIDTPHTYTTNVGGTLISAGTMVVNGTLTNNGDTIVL